MNKVFAEVGKSLQQVGGECPDGWIEMEAQRPAPEMIAKTDGTWFEPIHIAEYRVMTCTKRQGEKALLTLPVIVGGQKLSALHWVEAVIENEIDPIKKRGMQSDFNAVEWEESNPLLKEMWIALDTVILGDKPPDLRAVFELALTF